MRLDHLLPCLQLLMLTRGHHRITILHVGGNNIDSVPQMTLKQSINDELKYDHSVFSSSSLVSCFILPRLF